MDNNFNAFSLLLNYTSNRAQRFNHFTGISSVLFCFASMCKLQRKSAQKERIVTAIKDVFSIIKSIFVVSFDLLVGNPNIFKEQAKKVYPFDCAFDIGSHLDGRMTCKRQTLYKIENPLAILAIRHINTIVIQSTHAHVIPHDFECTKHFKASQNWWEKPSFVCFTRRIGMWKST